MRFLSIALILLAGCSSASDAADDSMNGLWVSQSGFSIEINQQRYRFCDGAACVKGIAKPLGNGSLVSLSKLLASPVASRFKDQVYRSAGEWHGYKAGFPDLAFGRSPPLAEQEQCGSPCVIYGNLDSRYRVKFSKEAKAR